MAAIVSIVGKVPGGWRVGAMRFLRSGKGRLVLIAGAGAALVAAVNMDGLQNSTLGAVISPLTMLADRGPGGRGLALTTTKPAKAPKANMAAIPPLAQAPRNAPGIAPPSAFLAQIPASGPAGGGVPVLPIGAPEAGTFVVPPSLGPGPIGSGLVPPQASLDPGVPGNPNVPPPTTPAVPELSTWAMMFLGLFGIGGMMRASVRRRRIMEAHA